MNYIDRILLDFLKESKIKVDVTGFDMEAFLEALNQEQTHQLSMIRYIAFHDEMSDPKKILNIRHILQENHYCKE